MADAWDELIARHGLTFGEAVRIRDGVGMGQAFAEPHLRAAAVDWARHRLETEGYARVWATRWRRVLLVAWLLVVTGRLAWRLSTSSIGRAVAGLWGALALIVLIALSEWNRRRLLRATITRNEGEPPG